MAENIQDQNTETKPVDPTDYVANYTLPKDTEGRNVLVASCPPEEEYKKIKLKKKPKMVAVVDEDSCVGCEYCLHVCPIPNCLALISVDDQSAQIESTCVVNEDTCIACKACETACPYDAIHVVKREEIEAWKHSTNLPPLVVNE